MRLWRYWSVRATALALCLTCSTFLGMTAAGDENNPKSKPVSVEISPRASETRLLSDLYFLAGNECEGRGLLTDGINKAADHIVNQLKSVGYAPAGVDGTWFQPFEMGARASLGEGNRLSFVSGGNTSSAKQDEDFRVLAMGSGKEIKNASVVFLGFGVSSKEPAYDDYAGVNVEGKVVIILRRLPRNDTEFKGKTTLASQLNKFLTANTAKAAAVLFVSEKDQAGDKDDLSAFTSFGNGDNKYVPAMHVKRSWVSSLLKAADEPSLDELETAIQNNFTPRSRELKNVKLDLYANITRSGLKCKNVLATIPGSGDLANEIVVVGAHYDHLGRGETGSLAGSKAIHWGADDNGSGSVTILELARRWATRQSGDSANANRRRVVFMWYSAEERGLIGSAYYCNNPIWPMDKTACMLNLDMVGRLGWDDLKYVGTDAEARKKAMEANKYPLELGGFDSAAEFSDMIDQANANIKIDVAKKPAGAPLFAQSDHYSFYQKNIPVLFLFTGLHPQYHRPIDTWRTINYEGMRKISELSEELLVRMTTMKKPAFVPMKSQRATAEKTGSRPDMPQVRLGLEINYDDSSTGVSIKGTTEGSLAGKAGVKSGDRIVAIDDKEIKTVQDYMTSMRKYKSGDVFELTVLRNGEKVKLKVNTKP